jgi:hypothetical protein
MSSGFTNTPQLVRGGIVVMNPSSGAVQRVISLQYNPDSISRTLQVQGAGENGARSEALRLKGPAVETFKLEAELDATDRLEFPDRKENASTVRYGLQPQIATLETLLHPSSRRLVANNRLAQSGYLEIAATFAPLTLFVWSAERVVPVRITELSVTEEAFDTRLNPIRARVSLGLRVLSVDDVDFTDRAATLFLSYLRRKEQLSARIGRGSLATLGVGAIE